MPITRHKITSIFQSLEQGDHKKIQDMLNKDPKLIDSRLNGHSMITFALSHHATLTIFNTIMRAKPDAKTLDHCYQGKSPLWHCAQNNWLAAMRLLLNSGSTDRQSSALVAAITKRHYKITALLLTYSQRIDSTTVNQLMKSGDPITAFLFYHLGYRLTKEQAPASLFAQSRYPRHVFNLANYHTGPAVDYIKKTCPMKIDAGAD